VPNQEPEMTNGRLARWLSVENLITIIVIVVAVTGSYQSLASDNTNTKRQVASVKKQQKEIVKSVASIQIDVAVIRNSQENFQEHFKDQLNEQKQKINRIIDLLERRN
jgi:peptidoglycan hydrolase CwlO-like protein